MYQSIPVILAGLALAFSSLSAQAFDVAKSLSEKDSLLKVSGKEVQPHALKGKPKYYVVYHSAGWCAACKRVTPDLIKAYGNLAAVKAGQVEMLLVDYDRDQADMSKYMVKSKIPFPGLKFEGTPKTHPLAKLGNVTALPTLVLVDANGKILASGDEAKPVLEKLDQLTK